jgi:AcrR family transcriptional regulator
MRLTEPAVATDLDRRGRRREQTRRKLLDAAKVLFARKGFDATRIQEITDEADVGFGSFYNHFTNKEALIEAVLSETVATQGASIDRLTATLTDPAEIIAVAHRSFVRRAKADPDWGRLLVRLDLSHNILGSTLRPYARRDLRAGVASGRLQVTDEQVALTAAGGALLAVMRAVLDDHAPQNADVLHAEGVLRLFGLTPQDAAEVARRPMPASPNQLV